jgi:CheY-like chemotaxis protein
MAGEHILIVDDNVANTKLVSFLLASKGYVIESAATAAEALALVEARLPNLVLMDTQLPGMDGFSLTRKLRADPRSKDVIIIALTAYAMKGDEKLAFDAGCDGYVTKPIDTRTFPTVVADFLAGRREVRRPE